MTKSKALFTTASVVVPPKTQTEISGAAKRHIEKLLREAPEQLHRWTVRFRAALLAGLRAGVALAYKLELKFAITMNMKADWGKSTKVMDYFNELISIA